MRPFDVHELFRRVGRPDVIYLASPATLGFQLWWQVRHMGIPDRRQFSDRPRDLRPADAAAPDTPSPPVGAPISSTARLYRDAAIRVRFCALLAEPGLPRRPRCAGNEAAPAWSRRRLRRFSTARSDPRHLRQELAPNGELLLLCVSRLSFEKGFDLLAATYREIVTRARAAGITRPFRLIITGGNANPAIEADIRRLLQWAGCAFHRDAHR